MDNYDNKKTYVKLLLGATQHLKEKGYWGSDYDIYPTLDGLICTVDHDYRYNQEYPHWGLTVAGTNLEIGISDDWFSAI